MSQFMLHMFGPAGMKESWLKYLAEHKHIEFERADNRHDFDAMFAMLGESEDIKDFLCWHMKMSRGCFGPYNIEFHPAFAPLLHLVVG